MWNYECVNSGEDYLAHHGILGMKWGVRRYQNSDGTLTSAGKKRYKSEDSVKSKDDRKSRKQEKKPISFRDLAQKGLNAYGKFQEAKLVDELLYGGVGAAAATAIGRAAVTAILKKHGHTNIRWYD